MIEVNITKEQVERAKSLYDFGELNDSIMEGESNIYGALGEILVYDRLLSLGLQVSKPENSTYDYDLIVNNIKVDVKSKRTTVKPRTNYNASITVVKEQDCDYYYFVRILEDKTKGWLLGNIKKSEFFDKATFFKKGELDPDRIKGSNWKFKSDAWHLPISSLNPPK